jgi:glycosyltransferase involved in cell wall biosynthesis
MAPHFSSALSFSHSANASVSAGGQGEILRQTLAAYETLPNARIFARTARSEHVRCLSIPFATFPYKQAFDFILRVPLLRGRADWLTILSDLEFDLQVSRQIQCPSLFEGVMGQCAETFRALGGSSCKRLLYSLNTHISNLDELLRDEHLRLGISNPPFIHRLMKERALEEIAKADSIRVLSHMAKRTFVERGVADEKVHVIHPWIDHGHFHSVPRPDDVFRIMSSSSIDPRKGIHYLLQAFVTAAIPNSELVIIGGTGDRWSKRMVGDFLRRHSNIRQEIRDVMAEPIENHFGRAAVVVHPALEDGYALTIPQALASGRPVIATVQSGAAELIRDGVDGFLVEARDVEGLAKAMRRLANDKSLYGRMAESAPTAVAHLTRESFDAKVRSYYEGILGNKIPHER